MPPSPTRVSLLSATCLATVTHVPVASPPSSARGRSLAVASVAALVSAMPAQATIITFTEGSNHSVLSGNVSGSTLHIGNRLVSGLGYTLIDSSSVSATMTATNTVNNSFTVTTSVSASWLTLASVTTTMNAPGSNVFRVRVNPTGQSRGVLTGSFNYNVSRTGQSENNTINVKTQAVAAVASQTANATVYALPGASVTQGFVIKNVGDGNLAGSDTSGRRSNLRGATAANNGTGWAGTAVATNLTDAASTTRNFTYTGGASRTVSATATITSSFTTGSTDNKNAAQTITTVFTGVTVAPVASTTAAPTSFGTIRAGTSATASLTVKNIGDGNKAGADNGTSSLTNLRGNVALTSASGKFSGGGAVNLTDGTSQSYTFTYAPTTRGTHTGTLTTALTTGSADGKNLASTASSSVTGTAVGPEYAASIAGANKSSGAIVNGGTIVFGDWVGGLTKQTLLISNVSADNASANLTDLRITSATITGSTEFSISSFTDFGTNTSVRNSFNSANIGQIAIQFVDKAGGDRAELRIQTDENAALGGAGTIYVYNLVYSVPEPGTLIAFGTGLLGLAIARRRARTRKTETTRLTDTDAAAPTG